MPSPSKESILALRRFIATTAGQDIINAMRSEPPRASLDPAVHVYAHTSGVRDGWMKAVEQFADYDAGAQPERVQRDSIVT